MKLSIYLWNDLGDPVLDGVGLTGFMSWAYDLFFDPAASSLFVFCCFPFLFFHSMGLLLWGLGLWNDMVLIAHSQPCTANLFF